MAAPIEVHSVAVWNTLRRSATENNIPIVVDFHAGWCQPCKAIAPIYHQLANQHHRAIFLCVDVDRNQPIATKYNITAMPTFLVIRNGDVADTLRGADPQGLAAMVARHAAVPPLPPAADEARVAGNAAFAAGDLAAAAAHYTRGLEVAPDSAVLHANRALMYIRQVRGAPSRDARMELRGQAMRDADAATDLEPRWGKGWVRSAEAVLLSGDDEVLEGMSTSAEGRREDKRRMLAAVLETLFNAANLSDGKLRADALAMRDDVRARLEALSAS
ncbi:thioredoxin-domain-containing protein [Schizophyllum commune]